MNIVLWVVQVLLCVHTIIGAAWKLFNSEQAVPALKAISHTMWVGFSGFELACALCLILPAINKPSLSRLAPIGAVGIAVEMLVFCGVLLASGDSSYGQMVYWLVVAAVSAFVAYGRFVLRPL